MIRATITRISFKDITTVKGPATKVGIQTSVHGDKWLGAFMNQYNEKALRELKEGDTVDLIVEQSADGKFLNFKLPSHTQLLEARVKRIEDHLFGKNVPSVAPAIDDIDTGDIPF